MTPPVPNPRPPYQTTAAWYDIIYEARGRDAHAEIARIAPFWIDDGCDPGTRRILDAGCGTGAHFEALARHGTITGVDRSEAMLEVARRRGIAQVIARAELEALSLGHRFDLVVSLFGAFGYLPDRHALRRGMAGLARHLRDEGTILIEPPLFAEHFKPPRRDRTVATSEGGTLTRTSHARRVGDVLEIEFEWVQHDQVTDVVRTVDELHRMLLLPSSIWLEDARKALCDGFEISIHAEGPIGRGLLVAVRKDDARGSD